MKKLQFYFEYLAACTTIRVISCLPRSFFFCLAPVVARILYLFPQLGKISVQNIATAFPEKTHVEHKQIAISSLKNMFLTIADFFWSKGKKNIVETLVEHGEEPNRTAEMGHQAQAQNRGVIFVAPHHGNWEFAGMTLALLYHFQIGTVVRSPRNPYLERLISSGRMVNGVRIIYSQGAAKGMKNAIEEGLVIGTLIDQNTRVRNGGIFVNFFGLPVPVSRAPAAMARKHNYFVASGTTVREGKHFQTILKPLPKETSEYASDEELTQDLMSLAEQIIREYPDQYLWMYKRFQYIPMGISEELKSRYPAYATETDPTFYDMKAYLEKKRSRKQ